MDSYFVIGCRMRKGENCIHKFRVDKICAIQMEEEERLPLPEGFDLAAYCDSAFLMYGDATTDVTLSCTYVIVGHHITDKFSDAEYSIKRALELDNEYHRAFLVGQLLVAFRKEVEKDVIISDLDSRFSTILTENKNKELIADYYAFRGLVCKEFYDYDEAEQDYKLAKEYGYDETIADLNIGILYYCQATSTLPKNERLYCFDIDVALIYRTIDENIRKSIYKHFGNKMIQEIKSSFVFLDD
jgi:tetratricopeptide (TPR) repeat protein